MFGMFSTILPARGHTSLLEGIEFQSFVPLDKSLAILGHCPTFLVSRSSVDTREGVVSREQQIEADAGWRGAVETLWRELDWKSGKVSLV